MSFDVNLHRMSYTLWNSERKVLSSLEDLFRTLLLFLESLLKSFIVQTNIRNHKIQIYLFFLSLSLRRKNHSNATFQTKTIPEASMSRMLVSHDFCPIYLNHFFIVFLGIKYMLNPICKLNIYISSYKLENIHFSPTNESFCIITKHKQIILFRNHFGK